MNIRKKLLFLLIPFIIGLLYLPIFFIERSELVRNKVEQTVTALLSKQMGGLGNIELERFSLIRPRCYFKKIFIYSHEPNQWSIEGQNITVSFSWLNIFFTRQFNGNINAESVNTSSRLENNKLHIWQPLLRLFDQSENQLPFDAKSLKIAHGHMTINNPEVNDSSSFKWSSITKKALGQIKSIASLYNCELIMRDKHVIHDGHMTINAACPDSFKSPHQTVVDINAQFSMPLLLNSKNKITLKSSVKNKRGTYTLKDQNNKVDVHGLVELANNELTADFNGLLVPKVLETALPFHLPFSIHGTGNINAHATLSSSNFLYNGHYLINKMSCGRFELFDHLSIKFLSTGLENTGSINISCNNNQALEGSWKVKHNEQCGNFECHNTQELICKDLIIAPQNLSMQGQFSATDGISGSYTAQTEHSLLKTITLSQGAFTGTSTDITLKGNIGSYTINTHTEISPFSVEQITITDDQAKQVANLTTHNKNVVGTLDYALIQSFMPEHIRSMFSGNGVFEFVGALNNGIVEGNICLENASIFVGHTANLISSLNTHLIADFKKNNICIPQSTCHFHKGTLTIKNGKIDFKNFLTPCSMSIPFTIDNLFFGWKKMASIFSGNIMASYQEDQPLLLSGFLSIDKSLINNNILSGHLRKEISRLFHQSTPQITSPFNLDVLIQSKENIKIQTDLLATDAQVDLTIQNNSINPKISGFIQLQGGSISFPYKKLNIKQGSVHFLPEQPYNPLIEIVAKNNIKQYKVVLTVTGSTQDPKINLESSPNLTEEQVGSLLMSGSEDTSWSVLMPTLITPYIKTFITGSRTSQKLASKRLSQTILKPLRHIRLIPIFTDQTGRDGFKTALEINASDRLHARIEKSFTITEDTSFEVDYALTDDIHAKIIKSELGDLGGEIEMRWKF
ncbi:hypothetical protein HOM50_01435 [bacterium]|nr:hypothetical protein [bacterium]MBT5015053.1 hypothetical protein [bacterium]